MRSRDVGGGVALLMLGLVTSLLSLQLPIGTFRAAGSGLFPLCLGLLLMALSGVYLLQLGRAAAGAGISPPHVGRRRMAAFLAAVGAATFLLASLGYAFTALLLMIALLRILELRRWSLNLTISLLTAAASHLLFVRWLQIPLPRGWMGL